MVLYFTTCNNKLFHASCKLLIQSFIKFSNECDVFYVFHENLDSVISHNRIFYINIANCEMYTTWFEKFKHIIPTKYGGLADPAKDKRLQVGLAVKWNQKACLWYWKIVAFRQVLKFIGHTTDYWVFLDSDTRFVSPLSPDFYKNNFNCAVHYHLGQYRKNIVIDRCAGIESGIIVFKKSPHTMNILEHLFYTYASGEFIEYVRWDDGYILRMIVEKQQFSLHCLDIVPNSNEKNVIACGPFAKRIVHDVGKHHRLKLDQ